MNNPQPTQPTAAAMRVEAIAQVIKAHPGLVVAHTTFRETTNEVCFRLHNCVINGGPIPSREELTALYEYVRNADARAVLARHAVAGKAQ